MLVIFDLDGVLFESRAMHFETLNKALMEAGEEPISEDAHRTTFNGRPTADKLNLLNVNISKHMRIRKRKQELTLEWITKMLPDPHIRAVLRDLRLRGIKIAVCSNAVRDTVEEALRRIGIMHLVHYIFSNQDVEFAKPHPEMYWRAILTAGEWPGSTLIVEDSPLGVEAARCTGAKLLVVAGPLDVTLDAITKAQRG